MLTASTTDEGARCRAVEALTGRTDEQALAMLLDAARDDSWRVRERAVRLLAQYPSEVLARSIKDSVSGARDPAMRNAAMGALVKQAGAALPAIIALTAEPVWELRLHATVMLGNIRSPAAIETLANLLKDEHENVVHAAAESLGNIGDASAVEHLVAVIRSADFWSQYPTVIALGRIAHHSATEPLLEFLGDEMLSSAVVDALGAIGDPRAMQPLLKLVAEPPDEVIVAPAQIIKALARIGSLSGVELEVADDNRDALSQALEETLDSEDLDHRIAALVVAGWMKIAELIPLIAASLANDAEQEAAREALKRIGHAALPAVEELLEAEAAAVRRSAVRLIAELDGDLSGVLRHIIDVDETVRMEVALAIGQSGRTELTEYLLEMLLDESEDVRRVALEVLSGFRADERVREQLYRRLEYYPDDHLPIIIETLGRVDVVDALPRLRPLIEPPHDESVRTAVVKAVREAGVEDAVDLLLAAVDDVSPRVRAEAIRSLSSVPGDRSFLAVSRSLGDGDMNCTYAAVSALGALGDERAIDLLESIAADPQSDLGVRVEAVRSLGRLKAKRSAGALVQLLQMGVEDVRREVTKALSRLEGPEAFEGLVRASMDPFWAVRASAVGALARFPEALDFVMRALDDPDSLVRKAAVRGLTNAGPAVALRLYPLLADDDLEDVVAETLHTFGTRILPYIGELSEYADPTLRLRLARVLGGIGGEAVEDVLANLADDPVAEVAAVAGRALAVGEKGK